MAMFLLLALGGLESVRRNFFELFYKSHVVCSVIGLTFLFAHYEYGKVDMGQYPIVTPVSGELETNRSYGLLVDGFYF